MILTLNAQFSILLAFSLKAKKNNISNPFSWFYSVFRRHPLTTPRLIKVCIDQHIFSFICETEPWQLKDKCFEIYTFCMGDIVEKITSFNEKVRKAKLFSRYIGVLLCTSLKTNVIGSDEQDEPILLSLLPS